MSRDINPYMLLVATIIANGGKVSFSEDDLMEAEMGLRDGAMLQVIRLPAMQGFELIVRHPNAPIQETATIIEPRALPAPRKG